MIGQIISGISNKRRAKKLRRRGEKLMRDAEAARTDFVIPEEIAENQLRARDEAFATPALQRLMQEDAMREQAANVDAVQRYATSGADAIAALSGVNQQAAAGMNRAALAGEEVRRAGMQTLADANQTMADYRTMQWDLNVNLPFLQRMQFAQDMIGAGYQGENQAIAQIGSGFDSLITTGARLALGGPFGALGSGGGPSAGGGGSFLSGLFGRRQESGTPYAFG